MTEAEWLACEDPTPMLESLEQRASDRKLRLLAVSFARRAIHLCGSKRVAEALEVAERVADRELSGAKRGAARRWLKGTWSQPVSEALVASSNMAAVYSGWAAANALAHEGSTSLDEDQKEQHVQRQREKELATQSVILRDIFGNPFRPGAFSPEWRTDTALSLARQMYESRNFSAMPVLADALQDAGCDSKDILTHCRNDGPHVRGCWVVDLVLGKE